MLATNPDPTLESILLARVFEVLLSMPDEYLLPPGEDEYSGGIIIVQECNQDHTNKKVEG